MAEDKLKNAKGHFHTGRSRMWQRDTIGDLLREECASGSARGKELSAIMERGELVPLDVVLSLIKEAMLKLIDKNCYFLIDGYPRELEQGIRFEKEVCPCVCVVTFDVDEKIMVQRLLKRGETSGRVDDNEETIKKRLRTFNESTKPVIDYYEKQNKLIRIEASGTIDEIFSKLCTKLQEKVKL
ncbi:unnamed protein product [Dicrocoelium dendriticum]|nr:unnamed protein product [Dicrocoelium dendriticum]